jgi:hypothetical protein
MCTCQRVSSKEGHHLTRSLLELKPLWNIYSNYVQGLEIFDQQLSTHCCVVHGQRDADPHSMASTTSIGPSDLVAELRTNNNVPR